MVKSMQVKVLRAFPKTAKRKAGMHSDTKRMIDSLKSPKGKVVSFEFSNPREAKNRVNAIRRAQKRKSVNFKEIRRDGQLVYIRCK